MSFSTSEQDPKVEEQGSWIPTLVVLVVMFLWWVSSSTSSTALKIRRFCNVQRVQWKKKLGLRDESIYKDGAAGDGANQKHKRQG
ncbi:hypothetical protein IV203_021835 [Nitzschia inconspicua]|uniref:Uncharacterized protein n=1 Tax=Nitzschia inconspicua TaxID=303405 RepID=A0A9K3PDN6_9STRA|nr:hypothetical protein IV203_033459 [Nitzschia inconspicua]KAG7343827.1 hypothetical protein IV203_021835 [Nitzschia inconspicua]